jgi:hypothetical protein
MSSDCKRHGAALGSTTDGALGVNAESDKTSKATTAPITNKKLASESPTHS